MADTDGQTTEGGNTELDPVQSDLEITIEDTSQLNATDSQLGELPNHGSPTPGADGRGVSRASSKASRVPTLSARAQFTRTPGHLVTPGPEVEDLPTSDDAGVLITELQASDDEKDDEEKEVDEYQDVEDDDRHEENMDAMKDDDEDDEFVIEEHHVPVETVEVRVADRDEDYDTDLENDEERDPDVLKAYYRTCCEQLGLVPVEYFLRHIRSTNIRMRYRGLGPEATRAIALSLKDNFTIERLDMCGNWIGADGARFMGRLLEENEYLTEVTLSENKIGSEGGLHLSKMIAMNASLRKLDISGNELDDRCAEALSMAIENNKYMNELSLSHNCFTENGAEFLGAAISANENLEILDLSWNHLREKGGIAVAKGLKENVRLKVCNLSWNGLDLRGGLAIADAMTSNQSLLELDMSGNRLTQEIANKFAKVLTTNDTIRVLRMGNNLITSAGAVALASSINNTENCEMEELDLTDVPVEYEFLRTLEDIKANRPNFRVRYGPIMRAGNTMDDISKPALDVERMKKEPVVILKEHIVVNDLRLLDILKRYDQDQSLSVTAEDFITALEELAVPYDKKRLQDSVDKFAATATGKIYFGSFVSDSYEKKKDKDAESVTT